MLGLHTSRLNSLSPRAVALGVPAAALVLAWLLAGCSSYRTFQIDSRVPERQIVVDGKADDWAGHLFVVEGRKISLGFLNDSQFLYVCLRTDDSAMMREFLRSGLMIWFDPSGGRKKTLGVKHPVGLPPGQMRLGRNEERGEGEQTAEFEGDLSEVEVYRSGRREPESLDIADARGIELRASFAGRHFVYELKIPLATPNQDSIGLGVRPGSPVGVGIETGKSDLNDLPQRPGGVAGGAGAMPPTGAFGGFGGRGVVGRVGRLRPNEPVLPENLKLWATVRLGTGANSSPATVQSLR